MNDIAKLSVTRATVPSPRGKMTRIYLSLLEGQCSDFNNIPPRFFKFIHYLYCTRNGSERGPDIPSLTAEPFIVVSNPPISAIARQAVEIADMSGSLSTSDQQVYKKVMRAKNMVSPRIIGTRSRLTLTLSILEHDSGSAGTVHARYATEGYHFLYRLAGPEGES